MPRQVGLNVVIVLSDTKIDEIQTVSNHTLQSEKLHDKMSACGHFIQPFFISYNGLENAVKNSNFVVDVPIYYDIVKHGNAEDSLRYLDVYYC